MKGSWDSSDKKLFHHFGKEIYINKSLGKSERT
jgi:hypothetical protein